MTFSSLYPLSHKGNIFTLTFKILSFKQLSTVSGLANVSASKRGRSIQLHSPFSHSGQWSHGYNNSMTVISPKLSLVTCQPTVGQYHTSSPGYISSFFKAFQYKAAKTNSKHKHTSSPLDKTERQITIVSEAASLSQHDV